MSGNTDEIRIAGSVSLLCGGIGGNGNSIPFRNRKSATLFQRNHGGKINQRLSDQICPHKRNRGELSEGPPGKLSAMVSFDKTTVPLRMRDVDRRG
jgi:hypothetical protein